MVAKVSKKKKIITVFGTTQTDPKYAAELAQTIQSNQRVLIDDFSERSLPCSEYQDKVQCSEIIHLKKEIKKHSLKKDCVLKYYKRFYFNN